MVSVIFEVSDRRSIALNTRDPRLKNHGDDDPDPIHRHVYLYPLTNNTKQR